MSRAVGFFRALRPSFSSPFASASYRYAWAERAKAAGYPERYAQIALGHRLTLFINHEVLYGLFLLARQSCYFNVKTVHTKLVL